MRGGHSNSTDELRRRAEERLQEVKQQVTSVTATATEWQRLVHELEVHQIELEIQNDELKQARSELEEYLRTYTYLYDFAPVSYFTLEPDGRILQANLTGAKMLEVERSRLINQPFDRFISTDFRVAFASLLANALENHTSEVSPIGLRSASREKIFVHAKAIAHEHARKCLVALVDITAQRRAQELLRESEERYRIVFETMLQGIVYQDADGRIVSANPAAEDILGLAREKMQGNTWATLLRCTIHEDGTDFPGETLPSAVALRMGEVVKDVVVGVIPCGSDQIIWLNVTAVPLFIPGAKRPFQVYIIFEDITNRKRIALYNTLTPREKRVFHLLAKGRGRQTIGETLRISPKTVDKHKENLMDKLDLTDVNGVTQFAELMRLK